MVDTAQLVPGWFHPPSLYSTFALTCDVRTPAFWTFILFAGLEVENEVCKEEPSESGPVWSEMEVSFATKQA